MSPTPPSTTSPSAGAISPEGHYRVVRKRNRVPLSCGPCRQRKLKCNRSHPCENCVKRGDAPSCSYAQPNTRKKNVSQHSSSSSPDDMQNRIDRLEGLVLSLMTNGSQSAGPAAAVSAISGSGSSISSAQNGSDPKLDDEVPDAEESDTEQVTKSFGIMKVDNHNKSYYISEAHWASVLSDFAEVRNYFTAHKKQHEEQAERLDAARLPTDVPGSALLFGATKPASRAEIMSSFPSKYTTDILVARYFNSYDPCTLILHGPTFQAQYNKHWEDPSQTCIVWVGMLLSIMRLAMLSYHREEDEPPEFRGKSLDMAGTFRNLMAQCLTLADYTKPWPYLIEALMFHLHGDFSQTREADVSVWVLVGVIARLAMRMGYHRDSKAFPNITPFQGEMRRRVWTLVRVCDLLFSFQVALPSMLRTSDSDTELPQNVYDDDLEEDCKALPAPRPPNEPTPISYLITKARLVYAFGRVTEHATSLESGSYDKVMEIDAELRRARDMIPEHLMLRPIEESQLDPANVIMSRYSVISIYHRAQCVLHRPYIVRARENPRFTYSRRTCIDSAMELLRFQSIFHTETGPTGRLRALRNGVTSFSSTDFLLAATIVVLDLYHGDRLQAGGRASGDTFAWGRERRDEMMAALQRSKDIWQEQRDQTMEAFKAAGTLEVMLARLNMGFTDSSSTTAPTFEPQDEKQNAAITLGLLSSGMSPMNTAPPGFSDPSVKMADAPLPTPGSFGAPADLGGAPSPFGSMFGQMPDMELNLDWDAWDTYMQNPALDFSGQWWPGLDAQQQLQQQQGQTGVSPSPVPAQSTPGGVADRVRPLPRHPNLFFLDSNSYGNGPPMPGSYSNGAPQQPNQGAPGQSGP
ncbi:putative C6 transcription factor [Aspergillus taichungensis]|uniref:Putative C6 transcription factor n=1 Tax=Aspergillus taichungensis TaxID=482145 RepID=A0A2J5HZD6_9EURO|nr:putative C6 transcription factor [Aspergillus taichungensis]